MSRVHAVIVSYNTRDSLRECLRALSVSDGTRELAVTVVDNASTDGSAELVRREYPHVQLVASTSNLGFAGGATAGITSGPGADYVLILNPDVVITPDAIHALCSFLNADPGAAAVGPRLVGGDGTTHAHLYRRFPSRVQIALFWTVLAPVARRLPALRRRWFEHDLRGSDPIPVDQIPGAALMLRAEALGRIGMLDPDYFIWFEDVDWCYRARVSGQRLYVLPAIHARHEGGASFAAWSEGTRVFQFYRAFFRFLCKHELYDLVKFAKPVLSADLALKQALLALLRPFRRGVPPGPSLSATRREIASVVTRCRRGEVPRFSAGDLSSAARPAHDLASRSRTGPGDVDVVIVNWNALPYLPACISALKESSRAVRITVVDNGSTDRSVAWLREQHPDVRVIDLGTNIGYAGAANVGLRATTGEYALVMNPDVRVAPDHIQHLVARLETDAHIGIAQGKLYRISADDFLAGRFAGNLTIDSAGHTISRTRMVFDRGQGQPDGSAYSVEASVFSACGAALFLRRAMLDDLAPDGEYFGESFFAYKEDIDLGWRARLRGWDVRYVPTAVAWHVRNAPATAAAWKRLPVGVRRHSWKNHYLLMIRNDRAADLLLALPAVAGWELLRLGYALLRDPRVLGGYVAAARELPAALRARRSILMSSRASAREMRRWFGGLVIDVRNGGGSRA